jgi:salicylate hydroxylase
MEIAVMGAGIAGLMTAITLQGQGYNCRVYERSRQAQDAGMGFIVLPEGIRSLQRFGVRLIGEASGTPLRRHICRNAAGRIVLEQAMPLGTLGIRRCELIGALMRALRECGNVVHDGELSQLEVGEDSRVVAAHLKSSSGDFRIIADLYVGAEGVNSRARQALFPSWSTTTARVPEMVGLVRCQDAVAWAAHNLNKFHADDGGLALGVLPVDAEHIVWYLQFDSLRFPVSPEMTNGNGRGTEARRSFLERLVGRWTFPIPALLEATDFSRVHLWRPIDSDLIPSFHRGNVALVGDAAHPLSPFTSQGVSSAIADALALAEEVNGAMSPDDLEIGLARYSETRREQCAPYIAKGREMTERFLEPLSESSAMLPVAVGVGAGA